MFILILGGGKIGSNLTRMLLTEGHEVVLVEQREGRRALLEEEFDYRVILGDATELHALEAAGIKRPPDIVVAVTGDDEDNIVICQLAKELYQVPRVIARVNDPRNQSLFDLLGVVPTVSATHAILGLIEHEVPRHQLAHLLEFKGEGLEIIEVPVEAGSKADGRTAAELKLPDGIRLTAVTHESGLGEIVRGATRLIAGDQIMAVLEPGLEDRLCRLCVRAAHHRLRGARGAPTRRQVTPAENRDEP